MRASRTLLLFASLLPLTSCGRPPQPSGALAPREVDALRARRQNLVKQLRATRIPEEVLQGTGSSDQPAADLATARKMYAELCAVNAALRSASALSTQEGDELAAGD